MPDLIQIENVRRRYRRTVALDGVSLSIPGGGVIGLVGENGAGKTTLIKHVLGLLRAQEGTVRVFGLDPTRHPEEVLGRIGYLSENRDMPGWMRVSELMRYTKGFYPRWDARYAEELRELFQLDPTAKLKTLSLGQTAKAGLLCALAHRPELLVLDEPSGGLDPIVRRDILAAVFRTVADEGRTVLFSSHLLDEVELASDRVVMVHTGRIVLDSPKKDVMGKHARVVVRAATQPPMFDGVLLWEQKDSQWQAVCYGEPDALRAAAAQAGLNGVEFSPPSLDEIFIAHSAAQARAKAV
ncbi:MAG: ABC transporter ATP-binding protein [Candidatus Hydrogenedentota bacterium]